MEIQRVYVLHIMFELWVELKYTYIIAWNAMETTKLVQHCCRTIAPDLLLWPPVVLAACQNNLHTVTDHFLKNRFKTMETDADPTSNVHRVAWICYTAVYILFHRKWARGTCARSLRHIFMSQIMCNTMPRVLSCCLLSVLYKNSNNARKWVPSNVYTRTSTTTFTTISIAKFCLLQSYLCSHMCTFLPGYLL